MAVKSYAWQVSENPAFAAKFDLKRLHRAIDCAGSKPNLDSLDVVDARSVQIQSERRGRVAGLHVVSGGRGKRAAQPCKTTKTIVPFWFFLCHDILARILQDEVWLQSNVPEPRI